MKKSLLMIAATASLLTACETASTTVGTNPFVAEKISEFNGDMNTVKSVQDKRRDSFNQMKTDSANAMNDYRTEVSSIYTEISRGAKPADQNLVEKWKVARQKLEKVNDISFDMKILSDTVENDATVLDYTQSSIKSMDQIRGMTREEEMELNRIASEASRKKSEILAFSREIDQEAENNKGYLMAERQNLDDLALSIKQGNMVGGNNTFISRGPQQYGPTNIMPNQQRVIGISNESMPLISMNMAAKDINYDEPLYQSLSRALERDPTTAFQIVSIAPTMEIARNNVKKVVDTLTEMGMPASRIMIKSSTSNAMTPQVNVYAK